MLGLPLGVGQGDNPTCQSARALSMWASNDPDFLLHVVARAARDDEVVMHFEGSASPHATCPSGVATSLPTDLDPVSLLTVPHLDRIYAEMGRRCVDRPGDPHRWVNPEFHGWWAWRGFRIAVDVATGQLVDLEGFLRDMYATYHPAYNGDQPLTHPQPAGLAVTDTAGRFVGWHAITLLRVAPDPAGVMRMYFFNPNDDGGQDWGDGVLVSTADHGERYGESSLPFPHLASRLYIFHHDPLEVGHPELSPGRRDPGGHGDGPPHLGCGPAVDRGHAGTSRTRSGLHLDSALPHACQHPSSHVGLHHMTTGTTAAAFACSWWRTRGPWRTWSCAAWHRTASTSLHVVDGLAALEAAEDPTFDAIVMDIGIPHPDGIDGAPNPAGEW
jgi:hypothetical protein